MKDISGISKPHVFLIRKQADGSVGMKFKKWHSSQEGWVGEAKAPHDWVYLMNGYPTGQPELIKTRENPEIIEAKVLKRYHQWMKSSQIEEWNTYMAERRFLDNLYWPLHENMWNMKKV
jgi:hypothetical protein